MHYYEIHSFIIIIICNSRLQFLKVFYWALDGTFFTIFMHLTNGVSISCWLPTNVHVRTGIQAELILGTIARAGNKNSNSNGDYLEDRVSFSEGKLVDSDSKAIMMAWEKPLMEAHAKAICSGGGHILNIGFGMGLVDTAIQQYSPVTHTIVEAHPEVYERMLRTGWGEKNNVKIIFGRWQDNLSQPESYDGKPLFICNVYARGNNFIIVSPIGILLFTFLYLFSEPLPSAIYVRVDLRWFHVYCDIWFIATDMYYYVSQF